MDADPRGPDRPGPPRRRASDQHHDPPRPWWLTAAALVLALIVGCVIAFQAYWIWTLHGQVDHLQAQVCRYQTAMAGIADALAVPPPRPGRCP